MVPATKPQRVAHSAFGIEVSLQPSHDVSVIVVEGFSIEIQLASADQRERWIFGKPADDVGHERASAEDRAQQQMTPDGGIGPSFLRVDLTDTEIPVLTVLDRLESDEERRDIEADVRDGDQRRSWAESAELLHDLEIEILRMSDVEVIGSADMLEMRLDLRQQIEIVEMQDDRDLMRRVFAKTPAVLPNGRWRDNG